MAERTSVLDRLAALIEDRKRERPPRSYTVALLDHGVRRIGLKLFEETAELVRAAQKGKRRRRAGVIHEGADLVYHLLVLLARCDVTLAEVEDELDRRFGISGFDEKERRHRGDR